jgi:hypothetical protein
MIKEAFTAAVGSVTNETGETRAETRTAYINLVASVLAFLLAIVILSFAGKYLWNNVIIELFTFAKPARSIWHILGLLIFVTLLNPCC